MTPEFVQQNFFELLADAFYDGTKSSGWLAAKSKECVDCGKRSTRSRCPECFAAYHAKKKKQYYDQSKESAA
jgi:hypothetical protein